ncbi:MAG: hypothetical protein KC585_01840 [Candidatus Magasanikbacteria bacterium]|nr:hypothetical protein [Candidatus Magasanikbacteria bacterium]
MTQVNQKSSNAKNEPNVGLLAKDVRPWVMTKKSYKAQLKEGPILGEGIYLPGRAFSSLTPLSESVRHGRRRFAEKRWSYPGFVIAPNRSRQNSTQKSVTHYVVADIYGYMRQQWYIVSGLKDERARMKRSVEEARATANLLLNKGHCTEEEHDHIMSAILRLEAQYTDPDFRDEFKIRAGDLFMQVGVDGDPRPMRNAVHAMTTYRGAAHLEKRQRNTHIMLHYFQPRFLQVRGVVRQLEDRLHRLAQALAKKGRLTRAYHAFQSRINRQTRNDLITELGDFSDGILMLTWIQPFAPQALRAKQLSDELCETVSLGEHHEVDMEALFQEVCFRVMLLRLIVRVERDGVLPLTLLEPQLAETSEREHRSRIFDVVQRDIATLHQKILDEQNASLSLLTGLDPWLEKLRLCSRNNFSHHGIMRNDMKCFSSFLVTAEL